MENLQIWIICPFYPDFQCFHEHKNNITNLGDGSMYFAMGEQPANYRLEGADGKSQRVRLVACCVSDNGLSHTLVDL